MADNREDENSIATHLAVSSIDPDIVASWKESLRVETRSRHLRQVKENETSFLCMGYLLGGSFCDQRHVEELAQTLEGNELIEAVTLDIKNSQAVTWASWGQLLRGFQHIAPRVSSLTIPDNDLPPFIIQMCLWRFRCVQKLDLVAASKDISSWGGTFSDAIREHPTLESLSLKFTSRHHTSWPAFDEFVLASTTAPKLCELRLQGRKGRGNNANQRLGPKLKISTLIELLRTSSMLILEYSHLEFCGEAPQEIIDWTGFSQALQTSSLKELSLNDNALNFDDICLIAKGVRDSTQLEVLSLSENNLSHHKDLKDLAVTLGASKSLKKLDLADCQLSNDGLVDLAELLEVNTTLEEFYLDENQLKGVFGSVLQAFANALQTNMALKVLLLDWEHISPPLGGRRKKTYRPNFNVVACRAFEEIQSFLYLNKVGRSALICADQTPTRNQWIETMAHVDSVYRVNILFYLIKANPSLCDLS